MTEASGSPLFVYGALRTGGGQEHWLVGRPRRVGTVAGAMWTLPGGQVVLVPGGGGDRVVGELIDGLDERTLGVLDHLEGVPDGVVRRIRLEVRVGLRRESAWAWVAEPARARTGWKYPASRWIPVRVR